LIQLYPTGPYIHFFKEAKAVSQSHLASYAFGANCVRDNRGKCDLVIPPSESWLKESRKCDRLYSTFKRGFSSTGGYNQWLCVNLGTDVRLLRIYKADISIN